MEDFEYGISSVDFGIGDETVVAFGDGKTGITTCFWADCSGIVIHRSEDAVPFLVTHYDQGTDTNALGANKVFITFDNPKSIDILIAALQKAKKHLELEQEN